MNTKNIMVINLKIDDFSEEIADLLIKKKFRQSSENVYIKKIELSNNDYKRTQNPLYFYNLFQGDPMFAHFLSIPDDAKDLSSTKYQTNLKQVSSNEFHIEYMTSLEKDNWPISDNDELKFLTHELENNLSYIEGVQGTLFVKKFYTSPIIR